MLARSHGQPLPTATPCPGESIFFKRPSGSGRRAGARVKEGICVATRVHAGLPEPLGSVQVHDSVSSSVGGNSDSFRVVLLERGQVGIMAFS